MGYFLRDNAGRRFTISGPARVGRDPASEVFLQDGLASRTHATVWVDQLGLQIRDEGSANGTIVNGVAVKSALLKPGDQVLVGATLLNVEFSPDLAAPPPDPANTVVRGPVQAPPVYSPPPAYPPPAAYPPPPVYSPPPAYPPPAYQPPPPAPYHPPASGPATAPPGQYYPASAYPQGRAPVYAAPASQNYGRPPAPKQGGGCGRLFLLGCLLPLVLCLFVSAGGFLAYQGGLITPNMLLNLVGLGPADIEVDNFRDDGVRVSILELDPPKDSSASQSSLSLKAFEVRGRRIDRTGRYRIEFRSDPGGASLGTCVLTAKSGAKYQFVALPSSIIINRVNDPVSVGRDLNIATSALCR